MMLRQHQYQMKFVANHVRVLHILMGPMITPMFSEGVDYRLLSWMCKKVIMTDQFPGRT